MEQSGGRIKLAWLKKCIQSVATGVVGSFAAWVLLYVNGGIDGRTHTGGIPGLANEPGWLVWSVVGAILLGSLAGMILPWLPETTDDEAQARQRVRRAEDNLGDALRSASAAGTVASVTVRGHFRNGVWVAPHQRLIKDPERTPQDEDGADEEVFVDEDVFVEPTDDRLTLAALWDLTHGRLDLYHGIVTRQARRSFISAQVSMAIGFFLLVVFAVLAAEAKTTTAAVSAGGLGAVGAAFAAYIGRTFIRSQETAASHLRAYFDQPLELSRYLAAERLLADAKDLTPEQRATILGSLVRAIATAGNGTGKPEETKPKSRGRQTRSRPE